MNKRTSILVLVVILMLIGFAAVSTTLFLSGNTNVASNTQDFDVYFSKTYENGVENDTLIQDKTHIAFETELSKIGEEYVLGYEVTNASKQYDTEVQNELYWRKWIYKSYKLICNKWSLTSKNDKTWETNSNGYQSCNRRKRSKYFLWNQRKCSRKRNSRKWRIYKWKVINRSRKSFRED